MTLAAHSRLCSRDLVWVGVFTGSAMSLVLSVSVIVSVSYLLLFLLPV